ncbi:hypothetical protein ACFO4O_05585 [Glaciecola siphonariae]|uniref:Uncharacterized protein n=1 Tax=Glaciecola siphonariae TaxID=521012 RepID=A0ABV9LSX9_9ALTE
MTQPVHVFIATTAGLVKIRGITHRNAESLASFVTVSSGSRVSAITTQYRHLADKSISPLAAYFEHNSYHMVLESEIDQGESWQLGTAIAHMLYAHGKYTREASSEVNPTDAVIIATGAIEFSRGDIKLVTHLGQKCLNAQQQIAKWQAQHCDVNFVIPEENYRQPLPDIPFELFPVGNIDDVEQWLYKKAWIKDCVASTTAHSTAANATSEHLATNLALTNSSARQKSAGLRRLGTNNGAGLLSRLRSAVDFSAHKERGSAVSERATNLLALGKHLPGTRSKFVLLSATVLLVFTVFLFAFNALEQTRKTPQVSLHYDIKTLGQCRSAPDKSAQSERTEASLNMVQTPNPIVRFEPLTLDALCALNIAFIDVGTPPSQLWLVADSYALLSLNEVDAAYFNTHFADAIAVDKDASSVWSIPLPTYRQRSRQYIILAFEEALDESSQQSLQAYLSDLHSQQRPPSLENLSLWASKQSMGVRFITHELGV